METRSPRFTNSKTNSHAGTDAAVHLAHDLIDRAARHLETSEERLRQSAANTRQALQRSLQVTQAQSAQARDSTRRLFTEHPVAAIGLAIGAGALLALWSRGRSSSVIDSSIAPKTPVSTTKSAH